MTLFYHFTAFTVGWMFRILYGVKRYNLEKLDFEGPAILASNHISLADPPLIGSLTPFEVHFMAKAELFKNPVFGKTISALNAFPVKRGLIDRKAMKRAEEILIDGGRVLIFPEGTRQKDGVMKSGRPGLAKLAIENDVPVLPVYLENSNRLSKVFLSRRYIKIVYGDLIDTASFMPGLPQKDRIRKLTEHIMTEIKALRKII
ncbi:MAG: 1-acyl-sn-glycerol-3-phosphate acyltransferase [candidate division Zixibacteria bacterium]|nr:1-acyl-sn-glycerol-3-phosphate acyltransferase [candidate division Zixibacteria bacterium]